MRGKLSFESRVKEAKNQFKKDPVTIQDVKEILSKCLKEKGINGDLKSVNVADSNIDYKQISKEYKTNGEGHLIFIEFVKSGHVAVVGAGKDIGFPKKGNSGTWSLIKMLKDEGEDIDWNEDDVIIIPIKELDSDSYGIRNVKKSILECRNGVEHCIGEYLIKNNVPILNLYSHKNYSDKYWDICENKDYLL